MFVVTFFYFSFIKSQLLLWTELTKCILSILMSSCDHIICPGLSILFLYALANKVWMFEKFAFEVETFSCDFEIYCILVRESMSLNN